MSATLSIDTSDPKPESIFAAHNLSPAQRQDLALQVLSRTRSVSELSREQHVSRKFLYRQTEKAQNALEQAFDSPGKEADVLFYLPVTKVWLRQLVLGLTLICHSSFRGVIELLRDLFDTSISMGNVHNIVYQGVEKARDVHAREDLSKICVGAPDEIFQSGYPILVGCDVPSTYCYLLSPEDNRDATTWGVRLLELAEKGFDPDYTVADFGKGLRAGQTLAFPDLFCRGDHFHIDREMTGLLSYLENRALAAMATCEKLEAKMEKAKAKGKGHRLSKKLASARIAQHQAVEIHTEIQSLLLWMQQDILAVIGPDLQNRQTLYLWVVQELNARISYAPHRIRPLVRKLENWQEELLAFAEEVDAHLFRLAKDYQVAPHPVCDLFQAYAIPTTDPKHWQLKSQLHPRLGRCFYGLCQDIEDLIASTVRASSVVENLNSRLRGYFFLRKQVGPDYLEVLRFFLNHRTLMRSHYPDREGKSPAEILTGEAHPHWLELLGFQLFKRA